MPASKQIGFCAKQYRMERVGCVDCETGKQAAKADAANVRTGLPDSTSDKIRAGMRAAESMKLNRGKEKEDGTVGKKECKKGCGVKAVKDELCHKHYKEEHGEAPFPSGRKLAKKSVKTRPDQTVSSSGKKRRVKGNGHADGECDGCKALQLEISQLNRAEAIMVAAGFTTAEKFKQAQELARA